MITNECPDTDLSKRFSHLKRGETLGPPEDRQEHPLDMVIIKAIESLPHNVRMYPELYGWALSDLIHEVLSDMELDTQDHDNE